MAAELITDRSRDNDGYHAVLIKDVDQVRILSRNCNDLTHDYSTIAAAGKRRSASRITLDDEIVALDASGRPTFQILQNRSKLPRLVSRTIYRPSCPVQADRSASNFRRSSPEGGRASWIVML